MKRQGWQDGAMLVLGVWLFLSPIWMPAYGSESGLAAWNAYLLGALVAAFATIALARAQRWEEWVQLGFGAWLTVSPFILGFYDIARGAAWNQMAVGILIAADAAWALAASRQRKMHR